MLHDRTSSIPHARGLTLVECVAAVAIVAVAATAAAPGLQSMLDQRRLVGFATTLEADLRLARQEAIARNAGVRITLDAVHGCYVIHTGTPGQCHCDAGGSDDGLAVCEPGAEPIRTVRWDPSADRLSVQSTSASMLFDPRHGTASPTATWRIASSDGRAIHHVVNVMGRVRTCAGAGPVPGLRPC